VSLGPELYALVQSTWRRTTKSFFSLGTTLEYGEMNDLQANKVQESSEDVYGFGLCILFSKETVRNNFDNSKTLD